MATLSHINSKTAASISHVNGVAKASISSVNGQSFPATDSVSITPTGISYYTDGTEKTQDYVQVTASGSWTASIVYDGDSIIASYTTNGGSGISNLYVTVNYNDSLDNSSTVTFTVTCGSVYEQFTVCRDGFVELCG